MNNKMENFNPNEWQGRRKDQYEYSAKVLWYSTLAIFFIAVMATLFS